MKIIITRQERDKLLQLLGNSDSILRNKLLKAKRQRKSSTYKKCTNTERKIRQKLEELICANYKMSNEELIEKLNISRALFYKKYNKQARELRGNCQSQALF